MFEGQDPVGQAGNVYACGLGLHEIFLNLCKFVLGRRVVASILRRVIVDGAIVDGLGSQELDLGAFYNIPERLGAPRSDIVRIVLGSNALKSGVRIAHPPDSNPSPQTSPWFGQVAWT